MTSVMIIFAFVLSFVVNFLDKKIHHIHHDNPFAKKNRGQAPEPASKPE